MGGRPAHPDDAPPLPGRLPRPRARFFQVLYPKYGGTETFHLLAAGQIPSHARAGSRVPRVRIPDARRGQARARGRERAGVRGVQAS